MPAPDPRRLVPAALVVLALTGAGCRTGDGRPRPTTTARDHGVAEHSKEVMPFDLTRATHVFTDQADGLVETVEHTSTPPDADQVEAIRAHLRHEVERFRAGDWSDPARIHGDDMPGLAELRAGSERLTITYADTETGGRITYATGDPALVTALHRWGAAQSADHGHQHGR